MARRPKGVQTFQVNGTAIADQAIKATTGILYAVNLSWTGANVGDLIHIHDHASASSGAKLFSFRVPTAAGSFAARFADVGKEALNGLFLNVQADAGNFDIVVDYD